MSVDPYIRWLATAPAVTLPSAEGDVIENMADTGPGLLAEFLGALQRQLDSRCEWCGCRLDVCDRARKNQRKCCPDCHHPQEEAPDA